MAKGNGNWIKITGLIVTLVVLLVGVVATWAVYGKDIENNGKATTELKEEGCKPANKHKIQIALVEKDISMIQQDITAIRTEQKEGFDAILKRLPQ